MIGKLSGQFGGVQDGALIVEVGGVGYAVRVPANVLAAYNPSTSLRANSEITLFVHTAVREDAIDLYGFPTLGELAFFKQLMGISGIGPKTALGILNVSDISTLKRSIAQGDSSALTKVFGIGKKSAERIVVELRDKVTIEISIEPGAPRSADGEVIEALMALGYSASEARLAIKQAGASTGEFKDRLTSALKHLGGNTKTL